MASSGITLLMLVLMASLASASHFYGGSSSFTARGRNPDGTFRVVSRYRVTYRGSFRAVYNYRCYGGDCGASSVTHSGTIDSGTGVYNQWWTESETVVTTNVPSNKPFQIRYASCCWIDHKSWSLLTEVDLGTRSDTGKPNSSPAIAILPLLRVPVNCPRSYNLTTFDPDGDQVRCRYGTARGVECGHCTQPTGFHLDQDSCTLHYGASPSQRTGINRLELVVEDFPRRPITLAYTDGSQSSRSPLQSRAGSRRRRSYRRYNYNYVTSTPTGWRRQSPATSAETINVTNNVTVVTINVTSTTAWNLRAPTTWVPWVTSPPPTPPPTHWIHPWWWIQTTAPPSTTTTGPPTTGWWWRRSTAPPATTLNPPTAPTTTPPNSTTRATTTTWFVRPLMSSTPATTTNPPTAPTTTPPTSTTRATTTTWFVRPLMSSTPATTTNPPTAPTTTPPTSTTRATTTTWFVRPLMSTTPATTTNPPTAPTTTPPTSTTRATTTTWFVRPLTTTPATTTNPPTAPTTTPPTTTTRATTTTRFVRPPTVPPRTTTTRPMIATTSPLSKLPLHFTVLVDPAAPSCEEGEYLPRLLHPTPRNGEQLQGEVNKETEIRVKAQATRSTVYDMVFSGPLNVTKHQTTRDEYVIRWTPVPDDVGQRFPICFVVEASYGSRIYQSEMRCVVVQVVPRQVIANVICNETAMTVEVEKASFKGDIGHLRLNEAGNVACRVDGQQNSTHIIAVVPLSDCGTQIEEDDNNIIFKNAITSVDDDNAVITRKHLLEVEFQCLYPKTGNVTMSFTAHRSSVRVEEKGFGTFTYQFEFFQSQRFASMKDPRSYPLEYDVGDKIYMQIEASSSVNNTELFVESCRAAPYDNPNYQQTYSIIEHGCAVDHTVDVFSPRHEKHFQFSMDAFKFIGQYDQVYISCSVILCEAGNPNTRCSQGCINSPQSRKRRELGVIQTERHYISQGPLRLRRSPESTATSLNQNLNLNLVFVAGCLLTAVAMICAVVMYKVRNTGVKYQLLPSTES